MTVEVHWYDQRGASNRAERTKRINEFDNEREAGLFLDGLHNADDADFESVRYPDETVDDPYDLADHADIDPLPGNGVTDDGLGASEVAAEERCVVSSADCSQSWEDTRHE